MSSFKATFLGLVALVFWATSVAFTRTLSETLGPVALVAVSCCAGGLILLCVELARYRKVRVLSPPSWPYLIYCGFFFVGNTLCYVPALSLASDRQVAMQLGVVNYLWPGFIVLGSVFFLKYRARWYLLIPGLVIAFLGIMICMAGTVSIGLFADAIKRNTTAFALMAGSPVCWGIYSNCARKYAPANGASGVFLFQLATGLVFVVLSLTMGTKASWPVGVILPLVYYTVFALALSYFLWDLAMQKGKLVLLGVVSYLMPLLSVLFAGFYFREPIGWHLLSGATLVIVGAVLSRYGVVVRTTPGH